MNAKQITNLDLLQAIHQLNYRFDDLEQKVGQHDHRFDQIDGRLDQIDDKVEIIDQKVEIIDQKVEIIDQKVEIIDQKVELIDQKIDDKTDDIISLLGGFIHFSSKKHNNNEKRITKLERSFH